MPDEKSKVILFVAVFFTSVLLPLVAILMMRFLGFMATIEMKNAKERIGPFIVVGVCYVWLFLNIKNNSAIPSAFSMFVLGATISLFLAFFINNFEKISLHTTAMSGMLMGLIIITNLYGQGYFDFQILEIVNFKIHNVIAIALCTLLLGLVATARLYLNSHNLREVMGGIVVGMVGQIFALNIIN